MSSLIDWAGEPPALRRPLLLVALEGFVDAGAAASTASVFLRHRWRAERIATFDADSLIDYRARRPSVVLDNGRIRRVEWPAVELLAATLDGPRDVLLLLGSEPDMRWQAFCEAITDVCQRFEVAAVIGLGAYPAAVPHTRPIRISSAANGVDSGIVVVADPIPGYTGPVGLTSALHAALADAGIPGIGLWAEVPHYIAASPNPAAALALVRAVGQALDIVIDTTELEAAAKLHREQVDQAVAEHEEARAMVAALERHVDFGEGEEDLPTGEDIAAEIERFLRSQE